jgi:hypothetical protein
MKQFVALLLTMVFYPITITAQQQPTIVLVARYDGHQMQLRWAPTTAATWQLGNKYGYTVERIELQPNGEIVDHSNVNLTSVPIKALPEAAFTALPTSSRECEVLREVLYNTEYNTTAAPGLGAVWSRNREIENRFGIAMLMCDLSPVAARAGGMFFVDTSVRRNGRYVYRVKILAGKQDLGAGALVTTATIAAPLMKIDDVKAEFGDKEVIISWSTLLHKGIYTAYYVERSTDGRNFTRLSELPYVHMTDKPEKDVAHFVDSLATNYQTYHYRVNGISPFGITGEYSNAVRGQGRKTLAGALIVKSANVVANRNVEIVWEFPAESEKLLAGFVVSSSNKPQGPFGDVGVQVAPQHRSCVRETLFDNTYYTVRAVDFQNNELTRSFPFLLQIADDVAPGIPVELTGQFDQSGIATLNWTPNTERDLLGYRVFRANSKEEEVVEVTREILAVPTFRDSVNIHVLNREIFYVVIAVDKNYNTSGYSRKLELKRPDKIPPALPVITRMEISGDTVILQWTNSISADILKHELVKTDKDGKISRTIMTWYPLDPLDRFMDTRLIAGTKYQFKIVALDSAGNFSEIATPIIDFEPGYRPAVKEISGSVDRGAKVISLHWANSLPATRCLIYRRKNESPFILYETLEGNIGSFIDKGVDINNNYSYKVQPVYSRGVRSLVSDEITLKY